MLRSWKMCFLLILDRAPYFPFVSISRCVALVVPLLCPVSSQVNMMPQASERVYCGPCLDPFQKGEEMQTVDLEAYAVLSVPHLVTALL